MVTTRNIKLRLFITSVMGQPQYGYPPITKLVFIVMPRLTPIATLEGHSEQLWHVSWSPNGEMLASCGSDKTVRIWGKENDKWVCSAILEEVQSRTIRACEWSPNGRYIACVSFDSTTAVWELQNGEWDMVATLEGHENEVKSVAWNPSGSMLATCSRDKSIWIWEAEIHNDFECVSVLHGHSQDVKFVKWNPARPQLLSASYDDTIKVWQEFDDDWTCVETLSGHTSTVWGLAFNQAGSFFASVSDDKTVKIWRFNDDGMGGGRYACAATLSGMHERPVYSVDWGTGGELGQEVIVTGAGDDAIRVFAQVENDDPASRDAGAVSFDQVVVVENAHTGDVNTVRWSPSDPCLLASAGDDQVVRLWRYELTATD